MSRAKSDPRGVNKWRRNGTMPRKEEAIGRRHEQHPNTAQRLLETAWRQCGAIQAIIDRLNEAGTDTEPRLLANRLHRLAFRVRQVSSENGPT